MYSPGASVPHVRVARHLRQRHNCVMNSIGFFIKRPLFSQFETSPWGGLSGEGCQGRASRSTGLPRLKAALPPSDNSFGLATFIAKPFEPAVTARLPAVDALTRTEANDLVALLPGEPCGTYLDRLVDSLHVSYSTRVTFRCQAQKWGMIEKYCVASTAVSPAHPPAGHLPRSRRVAIDVTHVRLLRSVLTYGTSHPASRL